MAPRVDIDTDGIYMQVMQDKSVDAKVRERATRIANKARRDITRAGIDATIKVEPHYTPSGRASYNVTGEVAEKDARRAGRIARRAGRSIRR